MELLLLAILIAVALVVVVAGAVVVIRRRGAPRIEDKIARDFDDRAVPDVDPEAAPDADRRDAPVGLLEPPAAPPEAPEAPPETAAPPDAATPEAPPEPAAPPEPVAPEAPPEPAAALTARERFQRRLTRARSSLGVTVATILGRGVTDEAWDEIEEALIAADVGVEASIELVSGLRERVKAEGIRTGEEALALLKEVLRLELSVADRTLHRRPDGTAVWLITGVNGTGKTTSIGKLAARHVRDGERVVLAAADTFRAAAIEQLETWGERAGARVVRHGQGADPAAVAFDGYRSAAAGSADLLLIDTAGRLQNKTALMDELRKVKRVLERESGPCDEVLLVLDATTGQNGLSQARAFMEAVDVSGVILTKLDGTAKGGIVIAIQRQLGLPVKLVGLGESIDDLADFDPDAFVEALFAEVAQDVDIDDEGSAGR